MTHADRKHAVLAPSFLGIALQCSGSVGLKEKIPESPAGEAAIRGTKIHEAAEIVLNDWLEHKTDGTDPDIRAEMLMSGEKKIVNTAKSWKDVVWREVFEESVTGKAWALEDKLSYSKLVFGTADLWLITTDERAKKYGHIIDLKTGYNFVDTESNAQLMAYALALREEIRKKGKDLEYVKGSIYQPYSEGEKFRTSKYTGKQLDTFGKKLNKLEEAVMSGKTKFKAGKHCRFCPCQAHCETYAKSLGRETSLALLEPQELTFPDVTTIPDKALSKIVLNAKALDSFIKACRKRVLERLALGEKIDGIKAVEGKSRRKIDDEKSDKLEKFCTKFGVNPYNLKLKGIGELEDLLVPMLGAKQAKAEIDKYTVKNPPPIHLVPEDDDRPAILSKVELLNDIEED